MPQLWEFIGAVTQPRTGTSSPECACGASTDIMPFNEMPESTKETEIEMLLLIRCQTFLGLNLRVALRLWKQFCVCERTLGQTAG